MSQKQQIDIEYKHIYGEPMPLPDGRVQVAVFDRITWHCACGLPLFYFGHLSWKMEHECSCGRRYELDGVHGITPRVSLLVEESEQADG